MVRPPLDDGAVVDDEDEVGVAHGAEAVGDDQGRAVAQRLVERPLQGLLGLAVEVGGGLVEHDQAGALEQQASDREPLLSPPESRWPRSPTTVSRPEGSESTRDQTWAARNAVTMSASVADGEA